MEKERRFPLPYEVGAPPGAEGWEELYPYHYTFTEEHPELDGFGDGQRGFWYQDSIHLPAAMYPIEVYESLHWRWLIGQQNNHLLCVPPAGGVPQRILNGYLYNSTVFVENPDTVHERAEIFPKRLGHYFGNWQERIEEWKSRTMDILKEGEKIEFPDISQIKYGDESYLEKGYGPADEILTAYLKLLEYHHQVYIKHFELQGIGYMGYMGFHEMCKKMFPKISDYRITTMLQGFEADSFRGDEELRKLSKLAIDLGVQQVFKENDQADAVFAELEKSDNGRRWIKNWKDVEDPWLLHSGPMGIQWFDKLWKHDLNIPLNFIRGYINTLESGKSIERDVQKLVEESDRIAMEYAKLLPEETKKQFESQRKFGQTCLFFAEDHQLFVHGWGLIQYHDKLRDLGKIFAGYDVLEEPDDIRFLKRSEVMEILADVIVTWANYPDKRRPKAAYIWPSKIKRRSEIWNRLSDWTPPRALGYPPKEVKEPYSAMLWGITPEKMDRWLDEYLGVAEMEKVISGMPGSAGIVEGKARIIPDIYHVHELEEDEILVTHSTSPDWGPVFVRLKGIVTDGGGVMSHAAIVAREYGIPAVVGTSNATQAIQTGDLIKIDGEKGMVEILERQ
ncbi:MAG: hypothetical protein JRJ29_05395 [Deltaproteobacteria bacterium]|nr:hypothetical protein [Deltaproteobacteria bacterium]